MTGNLSDVKRTEEVSIAYRNIREDNRNIPALSHKRSTYDPAHLTWTPRKRHNTRWPINPPTEHAEIMAPLQPLIKFELASDQIDETKPEQHKVQQEPQPAKKTNTSRRRTLRPSLGTILEESAETLRAPCLTPNAKTNPAFSSPVKQRSAAADRFKTPTKVAGSPMARFTLAATPETVHIDITNEQGHIRMPSPAHTEATTTRLSDTAFNTRSRVSVPSPAATDSPACTVPVFDQHADQEQAEPQHESKRRTSLHNARRSDRRSDNMVLKRIKSCMATTKTPNRRHSDITQLTKQPRAPNRRHTLEVDLGRTLDIFAQPLPETETLPPPVQTHQPDAPQEQRIALEIQWEEFQQRKPTKTTEVDLSAEIDEEVVKMYMNPDSTPQAEPAKSSAKSPRKYTPDKEIPWDDFKLFAGVKIVSPTKDTDEMVAGKGAVPDAVDIMVDEEAAHSPDSEHGEESDQDHSSTEGTDTKMDISVDISAVSDESDGICLNEPTVNVFRDTSPQDGGADETAEGIAADVDETTTIDKGTVDDDSALALLHSFVRRAQTSKQSSIQDTVSIPASAVAEKVISGSMASATPDTGSSMANVEGGTDSTSPRKPLEARDANRSPSPKKRKLGMETEGAVSILKKSGRLAKPDLDDVEPSRPKKRRKKMESDTNDIFNPEMDLSQSLTQKSRGGPGIARRSSRIATTKSSKADNAQSGFSTIPVRLPGSSSGMLSDMPTVSTAGVTTAMVQRQVEKDLATETRTNTRRNKGGAVSVTVSLVALAQQPTEQSPTRGTSGAKGPRPGGSKTVRWDAILARVQGEDAAATTSSSPEAAALSSGNDEDDEKLPSPPQMRHVGEVSPDMAGQQPTVAPVEPEQLEKKTRGTPTRRSTRSTTTASRLPMARSNAPTPAPATAAVPSTPKKSALSAPSRTVGRSAGAGGVAGRLGTPAPKRRVRRV